MCFYMLPRLVDGPDTETFFQRFYADVSEHWWHLLLQIRNFYDMKQVLGHLWYLSVDSQLFVVSILTLLIFRRQKRLALAVLGRAFLARMCHCNVDHGQVAFATIPHCSFPGH
ncbi:hypothetical protein MRX96_045282 [Rhipicephalus microplus]